ncbi:hypothetical protein D3C87_1759820 [compost metagenome]
MPVNRAEISEIQGLKHIALLKECAFNAFFYLFDKLMRVWPQLRKFEQHLRDVLTKTVIRFRGCNVCKVFF